MKNFCVSAAVTATALSALCALPAQAARIYVLPATSELLLSDGTASFDLMMDFATNEATLGGGVDIDLNGPVSLQSFTPSNYFLTVPDPAFSGHGSFYAVKDYEVHLGSFTGLSGRNLLGTLTINLLGEGVGSISLAVNSFWGPFYSVNSTLQNVTMTDAQFNITAVPEPTTAWLMLLGAGAITAASRLRRAARHLAPTPAA
jgi:PEP-CTERM motif